MKLKEIFIRGILTSLLLASIGAISAEKEILMIEGAVIRGNQELPNVLYIVPWQPPVVHRLEAPEKSLASRHSTKYLERASFRRLLSYHQFFQDENVKMQEDPLILEIKK